MTHILLVLIIINKWIYDPLNFFLPNDINIIYYDKRVGLLSNNDNECIVTHRGTGSLEDIFYDLESELYQECNENGFLHAFVETFKKTTNVDKLIIKHKCKSVYYTGHSLGSVTSRMAAMTSTHNIPINNIITYGEPKSQCHNIKIDKYDSIRVVNGKDCIPSLPIGTNISHWAPIVLDPKNNKWIYDKEYPPLSSLNLSYHHVDNYIINVYKYINNMQ